MKLIYAVWAHVYWAVRLKHDGSGLPTKVPAALFLTAMYVLTCSISAKMLGDLHLTSMIALSFILQVYVFAIRNQVIGLVLLIGCISNLLAIALNLLFGYSESLLLLVWLAEFVMLYSGMVNVIKSHTHRV